MSRFYHFFFSFILLSTFSVSAHGDFNLSLEEKMSDFQQLTSMIQAGYGPLKYKKKTQDIDLEALQANYKEKIAETSSNSEFYYLMIQFVAEFKDGHFGANLPSTHQKFLPIQTDLVDGKAYITDIKRTPKGPDDKFFLSEKDFPFVKGDEIVAINDVETEEVLDQIQSYIGSGYDLSERRFATWSLFSRKAQRMPVPTGDIVKISIRRSKSETTDDIELKWMELGEPLDEKDVPSNIPLASNFIESDEIQNIPITMLENTQIESFQHDLFADRNFMCSGNSRIKIPDDATVIMKEPFVAYYYPTEKGNIGYLRIPHYSPKNKITKKAEFELRFKQYEYAIAELEKNTAGLIIDQDHNCGGSVTYLEKIVGLFMNKPYQPMSFRFLSNKEEVLKFSSYLQKTSKHTLEYNMLKSIRDIISDSWKNGNFLTEKTSFHGYPIPELQPNKTHYTKPIVMLIDEVSGSGGDAFPSLLQGYGRAKLLGTRTSGLGGHVTEQPALFHSQVAFRMTKSLFYRPDGVEVENNGAVPDIEYKHTWDDLMNGYTDYQQFYTGEVLKLID